MRASTRVLLSCPLPDRRAHPVCMPSFLPLPRSHHTSERRSTAVADDSSCGRLRAAVGRCQASVRSVCTTSLSSRPPSSRDRELSDSDDDDDDESARSGEPETDSETDGPDRRQHCCCCCCGTSKRSPSRTRARAMRMRMRPTTTRRACPWTERRKPCYSSNCSEMR